MARKKNVSQLRRVMNRLSATGFSVTLKRGRFVGGHGQRTMVGTKKIGSRALHVSGRFIGGGRLKKLGGSHLGLSAEKSSGGHRSFSISRIRRDRRGRFAHK